jgi:hypothetical protein
MRHLDIDLGGAVFRAGLLEDRAPRTCRALWEALPFAGRAVHATWSGNIIHTLDRVPLEVEGLENELGFPYPGLVMYSPSRREISICYDDARYRGAAGPEFVTPIAEVGGDLAPLAAAASKLQFDGATPISLRQSEYAGDPVAAPAPAGPRIEVKLGDAVVTATLLEESAPRTCAAFKALLPLEGRAANTKWSGAMCHFWGPDRASRGSIGLRVEPLENPTLFHWPGYIYYYPMWNGLRIPCGDAHMSGAFNDTAMTRLARFDGDWSAFRDTGSRLYITGARPMSIRLLG